MLRSRFTGPVPGLLAATLAALAAVLPAAARAQPQALPTAAPAVNGAAAPSSALSELRARQAAERILKVVQSRDANARFAQFAPELQRVTSPSMIAATKITRTLASTNHQYSDRLARPENCA